SGGGTGRAHQRTVGRWHGLVTLLGDAPIKQPSFITCLRLLAPCRGRSWNIVYVDFSAIFFADSNGSRSGGVDAGRSFSVQHKREEGDRECWHGHQGDLQAFSHTG